MKKLSIILISAIALFASANLSAQGKYGADSAECIKYLSYYKEYYKQKSYDDATPNWREAYKLCPATASQNMLIEGTTLVKRLIQKNMKNAEYKAALVDTLIALYDTRAQVYPKYAVTAFNNKGLDLANYVKNNPRLLYDNFNAIIANNQTETKPQLLLFDLNAAIELYQAGEVAAEDVINIYQSNNALLDSMSPKDDNEAAQIASVKNDMGSLFAASKIASCENLLELFTPRIEANPNDIQLASSIVKTMSLTDGCQNNDTFLKAVTVVYNNDPSANSAYYLYKLHAAQGNLDKAISYMEEAMASTDTDDERDAELAYELATFCFKSGNNAKAYDYAQQAVKLGDNLDGKAYFLIGTIWGATRCGGNEITSRAGYWVACDYFAKAKAADETLTEEANKYISRYSAYFPDTADAFMYNLQKGQGYTASCGGMTASTTVKTR